MLLCVSTIALFPQRVDAFSSDLIAQVGHSGTITSSVFIGDGKTVATGGTDDVIAFWDARTGRQTGFLHTGCGGVFSLALVPGGEQLAVGCAKGLVLMLKLDGSVAGIEGRLGDHSGVIDALAVTSDGRLLLSGSRDGTVRLFDLDSSKEVRQLSGHLAQVTSVSFSPDGRRALTGSADGSVRLWDVTDGTLLRTEGEAAANSPVPVTATAFVSGGKAALSARADGTIRIWDPGSGAMLRALGGPGPFVACASSGRDGRWVVAGYGDGAVRIWDVSSGKEEWRSQGTETSWTASISPNEDSVLAAGVNGKATLWDLKGGHARALESLVAPISSAAAAGKGRFVAVAAASEISVWDFDAGRQTQRFQAPESAKIGSVAVAPNEQFVAGAVNDAKNKSYTISLWSLTRTAPPVELAGQSSPIKAVAISPDSRLIASADSDTTVRIRDLQDRLAVRTLAGHTGPVFAIAFSPDGRFLASGGQDATVRLWSLATGVEVRQFRGAQTFFSLAFSPDGELLAAGANLSTTVWETATGKVVHEWKEKNNTSAVFFSRDNAGIVVANGNDVFSRDLKLKFGIDDTPSYGENKSRIVAGFPADRGRHFITADEDGLIKVRDRAGLVTEGVLIDRRDGHWAVVSDEPGHAGRFETSAPDEEPSGWVISDSGAGSLKRFPGLLRMLENHIDVPIPEQRRLIAAEREKHAAKPEAVLRIQTPMSFDAAKIAPNGRFYSTGTMLVDSESGLVIVPQPESRAYDFTPDSRSVLLWDGSDAELWSIAEDSVVHVCSLDAGDKRRSGRVSVGHGGHSAILGGELEQQFLCNLDTGEVQDIGVGDAQFSRDGRELLAEGRRLDPVTGNEIEGSGPAQTPLVERPDRFKAETGSEDVVAFSANGSTFVTRSDDFAVHVRQWPGGRELKRFAPQDKWKTYGVGASLSANGQRALIDEEVWDFSDVSRPRRISRYSRQSAQPTGCTGFSPDGKQLRCDDAIWDLAAAQPVRTIEGNVSPNWKTIARVDGNKIRLFDFASGDEIRSLTNKAKAASIHFTPDSSCLVAYYGDGSARWYSVSDGRLTRTLQVKGDADQFAFSDDGKYLLTHKAQQDEVGVVDLKDAVTGRVLREISTDGPPDGVEAVEFSGDGVYLKISGRSFQGNRGDVLTIDNIETVVSGEDVTAGLAELEDRTDPLTGNGVALHTSLSPDGKFMLVAGVERDGLYEVAGRKPVCKMDAGAVDFVVSPNRRLMATSSGQVWDLSTCRLLVTLYGGPKAWQVVSPGGMFDTSDFDSPPMHWVRDDDPLQPIPLEVLLRQYFTPRLLARAIGNQDLPSVPSIAELNIQRPEVVIRSVTADGEHPGKIAVTVSVRSTTRGNQSSGCRDLRIFRDGRLVKFMEGNLKEGEYTFRDIAIPSGKNLSSVEVSAYAFNSELVKSATARFDYRLSAARQPHSPRAFVLNIGVNRNRAAGCDLSYAAADARTLNRMLVDRLRSLAPEAVLLISEQSESGTAKKDIQDALKGIAAKITPDDVLILSFSGHGYTDKAGSFYLFPSDLKGSCERPDDPALLQSAISSEELADWIRPVDAGEMVMILDACYSAASVDSADFKPGPMGSRGLGQLAYDKRIRILAASQSTQTAAETPWLGMGLLSFALTKDGLSARRADFQPKDGEIWLQEWLAFGVRRVPELYEALRKGDVAVFGESARGVSPNTQSQKPDNLSLQTPALFDFVVQDKKGFRLQ